MDVSHRHADASKGAYVQEATNLAKVKPPSSNGLLVAVRVEMSRQHTPVTQLDNVLLDILRDPAIDLGGW